MSATVRAAPASALPGILMTLSGVFVFSFSNALAKKLMGTYPFGETVFVRSAVALVLLAPFLRLADIRRMLADGHARLHWVRCGFSAIEVCCYYWAVTATPLADITTIYLAGPIYVTAMSALFLGEAVGWRRWAAVGAGFLGVVVAVHPGQGTIGPHALVAVLGSLLYAISLVAVRRLRDTPNALLVASQVAALNVVSLATVPFGWVMPNLPDALGLVLVGVISTAGYAFVNRGLQLAQASAVAPFQYASIVFASVLGYLVFSEIPGPETVAGAAIIVGAGLYIVFRERRAAAV